MFHASVFSVFISVFCVLLKCIMDTEDSEKSRNSQNNIDFEHH